MEKFLKWVIKEAEWWKFWDPRSGLAGGTIGGLILMAVFWIVHSFWG